jgi:hypothetical protein
MPRLTPVVVAPEAILAPVEEGTGLRLGSDVEDCHLVFTEGLDEGCEPIPQSGQRHTSPDQGAFPPARLNLDRTLPPAGLHRVATKHKQATASRMIFQVRGLSGIHSFSEP